MNKAKELRKLVTEQDGRPPARDPEYSPGGIWPEFVPGWYYQKPGELGQWSYMGRNFEEAKTVLGQAIF